MTESDLPGNVAPLPPTAITAARIILHGRTLSIEALASLMRGQGWTTVNASNLRKLLEANHTSISVVDGICSLTPTPHRSRDKRGRTSSQPVSGAVQSQRPQTEYLRPKFTLNRRPIEDGRVSEEGFSSWEPRLLELLARGNYQVVTIELDADKSTPCWPVHLTRLLVDDVPSFVAFMFLPTPQRVSTAAVFGWDLWAPDGPVDWRDDRHRIKIQSDPLAEAAATWRAPSADILATAVCHFIYSGMGCQATEGLTVEITRLSEPELVRRQEGPHIRRALARSASSDGDILGRCSECDRPLRDPVSAALGIGPVCCEKVMLRRAHGSGAPGMSLRRYLAGAFTEAEWPQVVSENLVRDRERFRRLPGVTL